MKEHFGFVLVLGFNGDKEIGLKTSNSMVATVWVSSLIT